MAALPAGTVNVTRANQPALLVVSGVYFSGTTQPLPAVRLTSLVVAAGTERMVGACVRAASPSTCTFVERATNKAGRGADPSSCSGAWLLTSGVLDGGLGRDACAAACRVALALCTQAMDDSNEGLAVVPRALTTSAWLCRTAARGEAVRRHSLVRGAAIHSCAEDAATRPSSPAARGRAHARIRSFRERSIKQHIISYST